MFRVFESSDKNVFKYVFTENDYVAEAVLYRYESFSKRTVICCSTMSGCPVGCKFCGTGNKFIRNLSADEIVDQVYTILINQCISESVRTAERFQIMFMSMGEPMLNWDNVEKAIEILHNTYPNAELLLSTIAPNTHAEYSKMIDLSRRIDKVGLQFSIHKSCDEDRDKLIPYNEKLTLQQIRDLGLIWWKETGRKPYLNYCVDGTNNTIKDAEHLMAIFSPIVFCFTFSVICSKNETMKESMKEALKEMNADLKTETDSDESISDKTDADKTSADKINDRR